MRDLKIAVVCMNSDTGEIQKNLDRTELFVSKASEMGVDLICFPELSITGYTLHNPIKVYGDLWPDEIIERVVGMAQEKELIILAGIVEISDGEKPYISQIVAGPEGFVGLHRKTHLSPQEKEEYQAGEKIDVFCQKDIIFGIQLCYEAHFPEMSTVMALKGAHIIFMPHASPRGTPEEKAQSWLRHLPSRAFDNALFVVACNQVGKTREGYTFPGVAVVLNPAGWIMARYEDSQEELIVADLKGDILEEIREHKLGYFIPNRRPELYKKLTTPSS